MPLDNQIIITLPASIDLEGVQCLINYLLYKEATKDSKANKGIAQRLPLDLPRIIFR